MRNRNKVIAGAAVAAATMTLALPGVADARSPDDSVRVVQRGDTLSRIAPDNWGHLCVVNVAERRITGCDTLEVGNILRVDITADEMARIDRLVENWEARPRPVVVVEPEPVTVEEAEPTTEPAPEPAPTPAPAPQAFSGGSGGYAIPEDIVMCESGGNYSAVNHSNPNRPAGAYQIITDTWLGYGGGEFAPTADQATPAQQDEIARRIWDGGAGRGQWAC